MNGINYSPTNCELAHLFEYRLDHHLRKYLEVLPHDLKTGLKDYSGSIMRFQCVQVLASSPGLPLLAREIIIKKLRSRKAWENLSREGRHRVDTT